MSYSNRLKDAFQRSDGKKIPTTQTDLEQLRHVRKLNSNGKLADSDKLRLIKTDFTIIKEERKIRKEDADNMIIYPSESTTKLPKNTDLLVAKQTSSNSALLKENLKILINPHKPKKTQNAYNKNFYSETNSKINRTITNNTEQKRSMSATYMSQTKQEISGRKPFTHKQHLQSQSRQRSATIKQYNSPMKTSYYVIKRHKSTGKTMPLDRKNDKPVVNKNIPRKSKLSIPMDEKTNGVFKQRSSKNLYIETDNSKHNNITSIRKPNTSNFTDDNLINFSQTLARAATNSPPIKRRASSIIHSVNPISCARFATGSIIDQIYTQKSQSENYEKYKKVANEILKENLALKFGNNYPFPNRLQKDDYHSSSSSLSSISLASDQQYSILSIPPDNIPLNIPKQHSDRQISNELFQSPKVIEIKRNNIELEGNTEILDYTVTNEEHHLEVADQVHLSDSESSSDNFNEYILDEEQSSSQSYSSDSVEDIEQFKKKFIPLYEIECMNDDIELDNDTPYLPDNQDSKSFRLENANNELKHDIFICKESLQRAKDALNFRPNQGILSIKSQNLLDKKKRVLFDPHILLLDACLEPDYELVKELVPRITNISKGNVDGITPLHNAVCSAELKVVLFLIKSGANINASDRDGWTPLHCAACCNNRPISKILVENGASLFAMTLSDSEIPSQKCNKTNHEDTQCEEYLFWEQEHLGVINGGLVYSLFDYVPQQIDELPLTCNQTLKIINTNPFGEQGWFLAENISESITTRKRGLVAAAYVSCYSAKTLKQ